MRALPASAQQVAGQLRRRDIHGRDPDRILDHRRARRYGAGSGKDLADLDDDRAALTAHVCPTGRRRHRGDSTTGYARLAEEPSCVSGGGGRSHHCGYHEQRNDVPTTYSDTATSAIDNAEEKNTCGSRAYPFRLEPLPRCTDGRVGRPSIRPGSSPGLLRVRIVLNSARKFPHPE